MKSKILCLLIFVTLSSGVGIINSSNVLCNSTKWVQPNENSNLPVWGHKDGITVGIEPTSGPRGLLRIYATYLGHDSDKMINYIAFEPIASDDKHRGFSELEVSNLDNIQGKRFWSSDDTIYNEKLLDTSPARGVNRKINGVETLTIFIFSETFENGAQVFVRLRFFENNPYEVELSTYRTPISKHLDHFILSATMGNYARLRTLYLSDYNKSSLELWPNYKDSNFTHHDSTPADKMIKDKNGGVYFIAANDEEKPQDANYSSEINDYWKYYGNSATQYWFKPNPESNMLGLVNGRYTYWGSESPIPGGISFENFELKSPFKNGDKFYFGLEPSTPERFIEKIK